MTAAAVVLHELPGRLRLRLPSAADRSAKAAAELTATPGVLRTMVNRRALSVTVEHDGRSETRAAVLRVFSGGGLPALPPPPQILPPARGATPASPPSVLAAPVSAPVLAKPVSEASPLRLALAGAAALGAVVLPSSVRPFITLANIAPTLARGAAILLRRGVKAPVLDALSIGVAAWRGEHFTANAAQFLMELSEYIEASAEQRSDDLIHALLRAAPKTAMVERDGIATATPFEEVRVGDLVHVSAGDMIPVDGYVVSGAATVNQSSITGESLPIPKEAGAQTFSGAVLEEGRLVIVAERVGNDTTTARIARFIQEALGQRSDIQRLAERLADRRVWISLGSGSVVYALTRDARRLESMFLVDYSCAIKLGSAVAVKAALYRSARNGALIKGGQTLEQLAFVDAVVFDKTGTLTHGDLMVTDVACFEPEAWPRDRLLATIASIAEHSTHPVAAAVVDLARAEHMAHIGHEEVDFFIGHGLSTRLADGAVLRIGSRHYLVDHEHVTFASRLAELDRLEAEGKTLLHVALDDQPLGVVALRDRPREEAAETLRRLRARGVRRLIMVTGDRQETARRVAEGLDLDEVISEADPEHKARVIEEMKRSGAVVAFVGDGVNDGPALMAADVGVAMPLAADIARATADIVLLDDRLHALADAVDLAHDTLALIRRTFSTAVGVNTAIMAGASFGWLPPIASSALHNGVTIALLIDALTGGKALSLSRVSR